MASSERMERVGDILRRFLADMARIQRELADLECRAAAGDTDAIAQLQTWHDGKAADNGCSE